MTRVPPSLLLHRRASQPRPPRRGHVRLRGIEPLLGGQEPRQTTCPFSEIPEEGGPAPGLLPLTHLLSHSRTIVFLRRKPGLPRGQHQGWHLGSLMGVCPLFPTLVTPTWGLTDSGSRQPQTQRVINPAEQREAQTATALPSRLEPCFPAKTQNETWHGSLVCISLSPSGSLRVSGKVSPCA